MHAPRAFRTLLSALALASLLAPALVRAQALDSTPATSAPALSTAAGNPPTAESRVGVASTLACGLFSRAWRQNPGVPNVGIIAGAVSSCLLAFIDAIIAPDDGSGD